MKPHAPGRVRQLLVLAAAQTLLWSAPGFAQSPAFARTNYPFLGNDHVAADFNRDGRIDLAGLGLRTAAIVLGNGDGTFQDRVEYPASPTASQVQALAAGDVNRDGALDLVVTINDPAVGLAVLAGRGDGTFNAAVNFPNTSGFDAGSVAAADLDNDGNLDVVIGHQIACFTAPCRVSRSITVMLGLGDGTFDAAREIDVGSTTAAIAAGDFNRDGTKDLVLASDSSRVIVLLGIGDGTFAQQTLTLVPQNNIGMDNTDVDVADLNGDTIDDLVVAMSLNGSKTVILIGNGDGTFRAPLFIQEPGLRVPQYQAVADYNGDGRKDLAIALANGNDGLMEIRNGNGDGTFGPLVLYLVPPPQSSIGGLKIVAADFNADGKPDLALGWGGASSGLAALRNTTGGGGTPPPTGTTSTLTVTATGRRGERVTSTPSGISVSVGNTGSASFTTGTSITLKVSNGREAIWSGACSSGGSRRRTCTFTLSANASVTANVR